MIGILCSDWSGGLVCYDWSTLLWLVRWLSLLWLVYSALIGQVAQSVMIGILCSDWSGGLVCYDWSTLLWLVRWLSLIGRPLTERQKPSGHYHIWFSAPWSIREKEKKWKYGGH